MRLVWAGLGWAGLELIWFELRGFFVVMIGMEIGR